VINISLSLFLSLRSEFLEYHDFFVFFIELNFFAQNFIDRDPYTILGQFIHGLPITCSFISLGIEKFLLYRKCCNSTFLQRFSHFYKTTIRHLANIQISGTADNIKFVLVMVWQGMFTGHERLDCFVLSFFECSSSLVL